MTSYNNISRRLIKFNVSKHCKQTLKRIAIRIENTCLWLLICDYAGLISCNFKLDVNIFFIYFSLVLWENMLIFQCFKIGGKACAKTLPSNCVFFRGGRGMEFPFFFYFRLNRIVICPQPLNSDKVYYMCNVHADGSHSRLVACCAVGFRLLIYKIDNCVYPKCSRLEIK